MPIIRDIDFETGAALTPGSYRIRKITITNKIGEVADIQSLITEFSITESLFSPALVCKVSVKDAANFIETFPVYGQETLRISVQRIQGPKGALQEIDLLFYVTEYPLFGRPKQQHLQAFTITGVRPHAYASSLERISRSWNGPVADQITKISGDFFGISPLVRGGPIAEGRGIINIQPPLLAIDWFRRRLFNGIFAPFYFYERLSGDIYLDSHDFLVNEPEHGIYYDGRDFNEVVATQEDYEQRKRRMLDVTSALKLSKYLQAEKGTFASENNFLDIATKQFSKRYFDYEGRFPKQGTLEKTSVLEPPKAMDYGPLDILGSPSADINPEELNSKYFSYMEFLSTNSSAYEGDIQNYSTSLSSTAIDTLNSFIGLFNTYNHDVRLFGDMELNAGSKVILKFPKAVDPQQELEANGSLADKYDDSLSGKFLVVSAIHTFSSGKYYTDIRCKRDSFTK